MEPRSRGRGTFFLEKLEIGLADLVEIDRISPKGVAAGSCFGAI